ncbi:MAG: hypothetical protein AB7E72_20655 [Lysobacterales bacterium]
MRDLIKLGSVILVLACVGWVAAPIVERQDEQAKLAAQAAQAAQEAAANAYREPFQTAFASADWQQILTQCREATNAAFSYYHPPQALALAADRVDVHVYQGDSRQSLLRLSCSADGLSEARIDHPLKALLAVEADDRERSDPNLWGEMGMLLRTLPMPVASIELLARPDDGSIIRRSIRLQAQDWQIEVEPPDAPAFARLSTSASLLAGEAELGEQDSRLPKPAPEYPRRQWAAASSEAFAFLDQELPVEIKASIAGMRIDDDEIELVIAGPVPGQSFAYATIAYDAWGSATTWLYPYDTPPSFGCATGVSLAQVRQRFDQACAARTGCSPASHFSIAFYSCASVGDGQWRLHLQ